jgi:serine/threonine-protein kinase
VPFTGADRNAVMRRVIEEPAPRVRDLQPEVPPDLDEICARCLRKDPSERYASAQNVADDLERYLCDEPISTESRGSLRRRLARAITNRKEAFVLGSGSLLFWGAASTVFAMAELQAAVLADAPRWVSQAAIAYYFAGWLGLMWLFLVARSDALNQTERISTALHFGAKFGCLAVLPGYLWLHAGDPVPALPAFMALVGLSTFAHGVFYWGRYYLVGGFFFATAALMPLMPVAYWPTIYGALLGGMQLLSGVHLRRVHKQAEAERAKLAESTQT